MGKSKHRADPRRGSAASAEPRAVQGITPEFVLDVCRRWWKICIPAGLVLAAVAAIGLYLLFEPQYRARALLWIDQKQPYLVQPTKGYADRAFVENQLGLIRSSLVLGPVLSQPNIAALPELHKKGLLEKRETALERLASLVNVSRAWGREYYHIECTTPNPKNAAAIVNAVADSYLALVDEYEAGRTKRLIELLEQEREAHMREVERLRDNVRQMMIDQTGTDPFAPRGNQDTQAMHPLASLESQLTAARVEEAVLSAQITALEEYLAENPVELTEEMIDRAVEKDPKLAQMEAAIAEKRARLHDIKGKARDGARSPLYLRLEKEIQRDEQTLIGLRQDLRARAREELRTTLDHQRQAKLADLKTRRNEYIARQQALKQAYEKELAQVKQYSGITLDLEIKRAELARAEEVLDRIAQRAFLLRTEQRAPPRVELLEHADVPVYPVETLPYKPLAATTFGSLVFPFLLALLWEWRLRRVSTADQLEHVAKLEVIGEIAKLPTYGYGRAGKTKRFAQRLRPFEESIESLRTYLVLSKPVDSLHTLAISSAASQEGKTTIAAQLAISIARATNELTLLVDGDMRSSDVHEIFDLERSPGLAEVLGHACSLEQAVAATWDDRLHILPGGDLQCPPAELLGNGAFKSLLAEALKSYRFVVVDTPPVLAASEALVMAAATDATILCTRRDVSRHDQVSKARKRLVGAGATVIGAVFNGIPLRRYAYTYGRYDYGTINADATSGGEA